MQIKFRPGQNGTPTDDSSAIGGDIDMGANYTGDEDNLLINDPPITGEDEVFYGIGNLSNEDTQKLANARFINRNGMKLNSLVGIAQGVSTSPLDLGDLLIVGKIGGTWYEKLLTLNGKIPVFGSDNWDINTVYRLEYLIDDVPAIPQGNVTFGIGAETITIMFGGVGGIGLCSAEYRVAIATSKDLYLTSADRKTAPEDIGGFSRATKFPGSDESLMLPEGELLPGEVISFCIELTCKANIFKPKNVWTTPFIGLAGNPEDV